MDALSTSEDVMPLHRNQTGAIPLAGDEDWLSTINPPSPTPTPDAPSVTQSRAHQIEKNLRPIDVKRGPVDSE